MPQEVTPIQKIERPAANTDPLVLEPAGGGEEVRLDRETPAGGAVLDDIFGMARSEEEVAADLSGIPDVRPPHTADAPKADDVPLFPGAPASLQPAAPVVEPPPAKPAASAEDEAARFEAETQAAMKGMNKKQADAFIKERTAHRRDVQEREARIKALEDELKQLRGDPAARSADSLRLTEMQKQVDQYEERLGKLDLQQTVGFQNKYVKPLEALDERFVRVVAQYGDLPADEVPQFVDALRRASPDERKRMVADLPVSLAPVAIDYLDRRQEIAAQRDTAVQNWKAERAAMTESERRAFQLSFSKEVEGSVQTAVARLAEGGNIYFRKAPGASPEETAWNTAVDERMRAVEGVLRSGDTAQIAQFVAEGVAFPQLMRAVAAQQQQILALKRQLEVVAGAHPRLVPPGAPPPVPPPPGEQKPRSVDEVLDQTFGRERTMANAADFGG